MIPKALIVASALSLAVNVNAAAILPASASVVPSTNFDTVSKHGVIGTAQNADIPKHLATGDEHDIELPELTIAEDEPDQGSRGQHHVGNVISSTKMDAALAGQHGIKSELKPEPLIIGDELNARAVGPKFTVDNASYNTAPQQPQKDAPSQGSLEGRKESGEVYSKRSGAPVNNLNGQLNARAVGPKFTVDNASYNTAPQQLQKDAPSQGSLDGRKESDEVHSKRFGAPVNNFDGNSRYWVVKQGHSEDEKMPGTRYDPKLSTSNADQGQRLSKRLDVTKKDFEKHLASIQSQHRTDEQKETQSKRDFGGVNQFDANSHYWATNEYVDENGVDHKLVTEQDRKDFVARLVAKYRAQDVKKPHSAAQEDAKDDPALLAAREEVEIAKRRFDHVNRYREYWATDQGYIDAKGVKHLIVTKEDRERYLAAFAAELTAEGEPQGPKSGKYNAAQQPQLAVADHDTEKKDEKKAESIAKRSDDRPTGVDAHTNHPRVSLTGADHDAKKKDEKRDNYQLMGAGGHRSHQSLPNSRTEAQKRSSSPEEVDYTDWNQREWVDYTDWNHRKWAD